jgi:hypothetical protein
MLFMLFCQMGTEERSDLKMGIDSLAVKMVNKFRLGMILKTLEERASCQSKSQR